MTTPPDWHLPYRYRTGGMLWASQIELPELGSVTARDEPVHARVELGEGPNSESGANSFSIGPHHLHFRVPKIGQFWITKGRTIRVMPEADAAMSDVRLFLLGSAYGALVYQRGGMALHASVVSVNGQAVAFVGPSGAGKSTLAARLHQEGYSLLCDDLAVIELANDGVVQVYPTATRIKLWRDALDALSINWTDLQRDWLRAEKYHWFIENLSAPAPQNLVQIFVLQSTTSETVSLQALQGLTAVAAINDNFYRPEYLDSMGLRRKMFGHAAHIGQKMHVWRLCRPKNHLRHASILGALQDLWDNTLA